MCSAWSTDNDSECRYRRGTACDCGADDKAGQGSCGEIRRNDNGRNIIKSG
ncbi:MAG: hypothetical protein ACLRTT_05310 [Lachnospiraceae bacterium]